MGSSSRSATERPNRAELSPPVPAPAPGPVAHAGSPGAPLPQASGPLEGLVARGLLLAVLAIRIAYIFRYRVDSDEPQHLQVVWQWVRGLVAYRDFFDNHAPLFHIALAPVMRVFGELPGILDVMRLAMVPCFLVALWAVGRLGRSLFDRRTALWAPVFTGAFPNYLFPTVEFRPDNPWATVWLLALVVVVGRTLSPRRSFAAGVLAGLCLALSVKTGLLVAALAGAWLVTFLITPRAMRTFQPAATARNIVAAAAGFVLIPGAVLAFFAAQGALAPMRYCLVDHNILPAGVSVENRTPSLPAFLAASSGLILAARFLFMRADATSSNIRRCLLFLHAGFLLAILESLWPVLTRQNYLPVYPVAMLFVVAAIVTRVQRWAGRDSRPGSEMAITVALGTLVLAQLAWILASRPITIDNTLPEDHLLADALRLTGPDEYVMTYKGEAIYRPRPFYYVLEPFTRARLAAGLIADAIPDRLVATQTRVAMTRLHRLPLRARRFLEENYVPVGPLRVAGQRLERPDNSLRIQLTIAIAADYTLVTDGPMADFPTLDGTPFNGSRFLNPGPHEFRVASPSASGVLLWTRAVERGFKIAPPGYEPEKIGSEF